MPAPQTLIILFLFLAYCPSPAVHAATNGGTWQLLQNSIGISAMHMQLLHNDRLITFDRTDFGRSNLSLPHGKCRNDPRDTALKKDCTAHSVEYDVLTNTFRPLMVLTDVWCSSGSVLSNGQLVQTGGFNDGEQVVRVFKPCDEGRYCDWNEIGSQLLRRRWYATNQALPDGRMIIIGGRKQFNYEYYPKKSGGTGNGKLYGLRFLEETNDPKDENNLYPFVFLNVDGNLFIFANNRAVLFNYRKDTVVRSYPVVPGGDPRSYPSTGSAVLLPLKNLDGDAAQEAEVLVCGGAPRGSFEEAQKGRFMQALKTCARIKINDRNPQWELETMPSARAMGDMLLLPNGNVLIINGAGSGTAGWESGRDPVLKPVIYDPSAPSGSRFEVQNPTTVPRVYHSAAVLVRDGRVLVGGSNPHAYYNFTDVLYPTELSLEAFSPPYLDQSVSALRPRIFYPASNEVKLRYGGSFTVRFSIEGDVDRSQIKVTMVSPSFNTHSFAQSQRLLELSAEEIRVVGEPKPVYQVGVRAPGSPNLSPPGYYMLFVVYKGIPSEGIWVRVGKLEE